jgi:hypothetical protein
MTDEGLHKIMNPPSVNEEHENTSVSLREHIDMRFDLMQRAVDKAEVTADRRLVKIEDDIGRTLSKDEYRDAHAGLIEKIESLQKMVWIGLGIVATAQFIATFMLAFFKHS